jgi:hypothetical protein
MKYYSRKIFLGFLFINILSVIFTLLVSISQFLWDGMREQLVSTNPNFVYYLFLFIIPLPSIIFSILIITLQQKGYRRYGYFMIILAIISSCYLIYPQVKWSFWSNIGYFISEQPFLYNFAEFVLILAALIPFYVLARLIKTDFLDKK